ncbi:DHA2 family efflux MFS transporter permease subunit [Nesterenkonia xinjiangensis]|uniref:DHA2 family lincomycin resistance protein-like MFS transporter n=2 Tax=Nesterenkonia xinjiangensis TaxID=225327 RepID=A0A7Z0GKX3_9MICC|nr:DHA2 family efflux MFS transporter permease subunit [Nesterenkonia xinjiangensis]NYJ77633.1 DHA2 family lincomycin resistance protein-like MFS transporter [Nesterenkonia xinjiangensis]
MSAHPTPPSASSVGVEAPKMPRGDKLTIGALLLAAFIMILNETIMNVALQPLMVEFQVDETTIQWLTTAFMLTLATIIPTTGYLMQRFSLRAVFTISLVLFCAGTAIAAAAFGFPMLLVGRIIQAAGTAMMLPLLMTTTLTLVPLQRRGVVMGNISIVISVAPATGPALSGLILHIADWRFLFLLILPIALAAMVLGRPRLDDSPGVKGGGLSVPSLLLSVPGFSGVVYGISQLGGGHGEGAGVDEAAEAGVDVVALVVLVIGVLFLAAFTWLQLRLQKGGNPLLNLQPFRYTMFTRSLLMMLLMMIALFGAIIMLPLFLQQVRGLDTLTTGLLMLPGGVLMALLAPIVGRLYDRIGPKPLVVPGAALLIVALFLMSLLGPDSSVWSVLTLHLVLSFGLACLFTPAFTTAMNPLPQPLYSHGSAVLNTLQQLAAAVGTALLVTVMGLGAAAAASNGLDPEAAAVEGFRTAFRTAAAMSVGTLLLGLTLRATPAGESDPVAEPDAEGADEGRSGQEEAATSTTR